MWQLPTLNYIIHYLIHSTNNDSIPITWEHNVCLGSSPLLYVIMDYAHVYLLLEGTLKMKMQLIMLCPA